MLLNLIVLNEGTASLRGILYKNIDNCIDEIAVLDNRTAKH